MRRPDRRPRSLSAKARLTPVVLVELATVLTCCLSGTGGFVLMSNRNATFLVPTLIYRLIDEAALRARYDLSSLDLIIYGAAPMSPDRLLEAMRIFGRVFLQLYGQTEAPQSTGTAGLVRPAQSAGRRASI